MKNGDHVLIYYDKALHYFSSVTNKIQNPELAKELWGTDDNGDTWEYIYFLTKPQEIIPPLPTAEVSTYMHKLFRGFTQLSEERRDKLYKNFGTLEEFLSQNKIVTNKEKKCPQKLNSVTCSLQ